MMNKDIFVKLLQERRYKSVKDVLDVMNAVDIASLLGEFDDKEPVSYTHLRAHET